MFPAEDLTEQPAMYEVITSDTGSGSVVAAARTSGIEGKTHREALRCRKRQIVKAIWRTMRDDSRNQSATP